MKNRTMPPDAQKIREKDGGHSVKGRMVTGNVEVERRAG
jgi:hypothetical protein